MPTLRDSSGKAYDVPDDQVEAYRQQGFTPESDQQRLERIESDVREDIYGGALGAAGALGAGALRTATLGLSDVAISGLGGAHQLRQLRAENPTATVVGELAGGFSPIGPAGRLTGAGRSIMEAGAGAGALTRAGYAAAGAAVEGAGFGGGQYVSQIALEDKPLSAEGFMASMGHGALWGAPIGGGLSLAGSAMTRARSLFPQHQVTPEAARVVGSEAKGTLKQALDDGDEMVSAAQRRLALTEVKSGMGETGERVTRRMFGDADPAALADQVANGAEGAQLAAALERYQVSRSRLGEWIRSEADPELEAALREIADVDIQAPVVPIGEFGAPGKGGFKSQDELAKLALGTDADGLAPALEATKALRSKGTPQPRSLGDVAAGADDGRLKNALESLARPADDVKTIGETKVGRRPELPTSANADVSLEALLAGTKAQLDEGKSLIEISNASPLRKSYVASKQLDRGLPLGDVPVPVSKIDDVAASGGKSPLSSDDDSLLALLSGTKAQLDEGKTIGDVAAGAKSSQGAVPTYDGLAAKLDQSGDDYLEQTLPAAAISKHGYYEPAGGGVDKVRVENARKAIAEGQRDPIKLNVSPTGKITVTDGRHRLAAAVDADAPIKVKWTTGLEPTADDVRRGGAKTAATSEVQGGDDDLMALLSGTKKQLDEGVAIKDVAKAAAAVPPKPASVIEQAIEAPQSTTIDKGLRARVRASARDDEALAKTIVDRGMRANVQRATDDDAIAKLLSKHVGKGVDVGPELGRAAKVIGEFEEAGADLVELLGPEAPPAASARATAYRAAAASQADQAASGAAQAARGIKGKLIPALNNATGGKAGKALSALSDVGTAIEVLKAMGVSVPDISNIPVIGPVLSAYLKARAVLGIVGRKGGSIRRSAESVVAAKAAEARNRMNAATVAMLDAGAKGARKASVFAVGPAVTLATRLFPGDGDTKSKDPRKLYAARMDELSRASAPGAVRAAVSDRIQTSDPALQDAIVSQVERGLQFIARKAPRQGVMPTMLPGDGKWHPSKAALEQWGRYIHAVNNPASVLEDLVHGHVTIEGAEVLREVYPALYGEAQRFLLERAPQMQATLPYRRRVMISIMYGVPVDGTMSARHMQYLQPPQQPQQMPANANTPPAPTGGPALTSPLAISQQTMTSLERRAGA